MNQDMLYQCVICNHQEIVSADETRKDGIKCTLCGEYATPTGYIGIDFSGDKEHTVIHVGNCKKRFIKSTIAKRLKQVNRQLDNTQHDVNEHEQLLQELKNELNLLEIERKELKDFLINL